MKRTEHTVSTVHFPFSPGLCLNFSIFTLSQYIYCSAERPFMSAVLWGHKKAEPRPRKTSHRSFVWVEVLYRRIMLHIFSASPSPCFCLNIPDVLLLFLLFHFTHLYRLQALTNPTSLLRQISRASLEQSTRTAGRSLTLKLLHSE